MTKRRANYIIIASICIVIFIMIGMLSIFKPIEIVGSSMEDTYYNGDIIWINKLKKIVVNDIVVFKYGDSFMVKRVVGVSENLIEIIDNKLYRNGALVATFDDKMLNDNAHCKLSDGEYYVLGDNYNISMDSRSLGVINRKDIIGVAIS